MITFSDFVRKFATIGKKQFAFFLGAGASASSNVPTAQEMIRDFKRRLYSENKNIKVTLIENREYEFSYEIENWVKVKYKNIPENEYGFFFEKTYPSAIDRRNYISKMLESATPSIGYQIIRLLIENGIIWHYITTNFDNLVQRVYPNIAEISEESITNRKNLIRVNSGHPIVIKLHGDFRYDWLRNIGQETQQLNEDVMNSMGELLKSLGLIVLGYSGRDESVMTFLENFVDREEKPFPNGFFWCVREDAISSRVNILINKVRGKGIEAEMVKITDFEDLCIGLYNQIGIDDAGVDEWLSSNRKVQPFTSSRSYRENYVVLNFMKVIEFPKPLLTFGIRNIRNWTELDVLLKGKDILASFFRDGKVIAIGDESRIKEIFKKYYNEKYSYEYYMLTDSDLSRINKQRGFLYCLFYKMFDWHFVNMLKFLKYDRGGKRVYYVEDKLIKKLPKYSSTLYYHRAFYYSLEYRDNQLLFLLTPYYLCTEFDTLDSNKFKMRQNQLISNMYNNIVLDDIVYWVKKLRSSSKDNIEIFYPADTNRFLIQPLFYKCGEGMNE